MTERLRAVRGLIYPDATSLERVRRAGGLSKLTPEDRAKVKFKRVEPGGLCDDLPEESRAHYLANGTVKAEAAVDVESPKRKSWPRKDK